MPGGMARGARLPVIITMTTIIIIVNMFMIITTLSDAKWHEQRCQVDDQDLGQDQAQGRHLPPYHYHDDDDVDDDYDDNDDDNVGDCSDKASTPGTSHPTLMMMIKM